MKSLIGFNIICFAVCTLIIVLMHDGSLKEKIQLLVGEIIFVALISVGVCLLSCNS